VTPILQLARLSGFTVGSFVSNESVVDDGELLFSPSGNLFFGNLVDSGNTLFLFLRRRRIVVPNSIRFRSITFTCLNFL